MLLLSIIQAVLLEKYDYTEDKIEDVGLVCTNCSVYCVHLGIWALMQFA